MAIIRSKCTRTLSNFTIFISEFGKHEYLAMPMGLKNAGCTFQRMTDKVLEGLIGEIFYVYLDDIIIFSEDLEGREDSETILYGL